MRLHWLAAMVIMAACWVPQEPPKANGSDGITVATALDSRAALRHLLSASSQTTWDVQSVVHGDLDCDGFADAAAFGRERWAVVVGVVRASGGAPGLLRRPTNSGQAGVE